MNQTPDSQAGFFFQQGVSHLNSGEYEEAIASYDQALALQPYYH